MTPRRRRRSSSPLVEWREASRTRSFKITLILSAVALAAIIVIANLVGGNGEDPTQVVLAGPAADEQVDALQALGQASGVEVDVTTAADDAAAEMAVLDGDADVAVVDDGGRIVTKNEVDTTGTSQLARVVNLLRADLALQNGLRAAGLSPEEAAQVRATAPPPVEALQAKSDEIDAGRVAAATITNILLFLMLQTYGAWVLTAVTREKASRIVEVLLAVIRPVHLLVGKIIGIGAVALMHAAVLIVVAFATTRIVGADITAGLRAGDLAIGAVWFLLGYALYCSAFAAAGSLCARVEDAQGVSFPIMLPLLFAYIASFSAASGANTLLWILAFIPPTAVLAMPTLYGIGAAPVWAMLLSMALTVAAIVLVALLAARIYERSVLHTGRKLSWREAFRGRNEIQSRPVAVTAS